MPVHIQSTDLPCSNEEVQKLWHHTCQILSCSDQEVSVASVSKEHIRTLNKDYRQKDKPTNVLTFSYEDAHSKPSSSEHDVVICLEVAQEEALLREVEYKDYVALLLTHAFLHVCGMDHERSAEEEKQTQERERRILATAGFSPIFLS